MYGLLGRVGACLLRWIYGYIIAMVLAVEGAQVRERKILDEERINLEMGSISGERRKEFYWMRWYIDMGILLHS